MNFYILKSSICNPVTSSIFYKLHRALIKLTSFYPRYSDKRFLRQHVLCNEFFDE